MNMPSKTQHHNDTWFANAALPIPSLFLVLFLIYTPAIQSRAASRRLTVEPELTMAVRRRSLPDVKRLLSEGANVNETDEGLEQTPLMRAAQVGDVVIARTLIAHGAAVNARDDANQSALMFAAAQGNSGLVQLLLDHGAVSGWRDSSGATARTFAVRTAHPQIVRLLEKAARNQQVAYRR